MLKGYPRTASFGKVSGKMLEVCRCAITYCEGCKINESKSFGIHLSFKIKQLKSHLLKPSLFVTFYKTHITFLLTNEDHSYDLPFF
jgi:hypothetical protein